MRYRGKMSIVTLGETDILNKCTTVNFTKDGRTMSITSHTSGGVKHKVRVTKNYHDCMKVNILMDALIATMKRQKIYKLKQLLSHWKRSLVRSSFTNHPESWQCPNIGSHTICRFLGDSCILYIPHRQPLPLFAVVQYNRNAMSYFYTSIFYYDVCIDLVVWCYVAEYRQLL